MKLLNYILNYKSKAGMALAGIYVLFVIWVFVEVTTMQSPNSTTGLALPFVTAPGSFELGIMLDSFGVGDGMHIGLICVFFGGAINALGLYFLGYLFTTMFIALRDAIKDLLSRRSRK